MGVSSAFLALRWELSHAYNVQKEKVYRFPWLSFFSPPSASSTANFNSSGLLSHFKLSTQFCLHFSLFLSQLPFLSFIEHKNRPWRQDVIFNPCLPGVSANLHQQQTRRHMAGPWIELEGVGTKPSQSRWLFWSVGRRKAGISYSERLYLQGKLEKKE